MATVGHVNSGSGLRNF